MLLLLDPWPPGLHLYPFRFRDPLTGRWIRARYKATWQEIGARYREAEITGPAEIRQAGSVGFTPWA